MGSHDFDKLGFFNGQFFSIIIEKLKLKFFLIFVDSMSDPIISKKKIFPIIYKKKQGTFKKR